MQTTEEKTKGIPVPKQQFQGSGFIVTIGDDVHVTTDHPVEDFDLYTFSLGNVVFLRAYSGNHPNFPRHILKNGKKEKLLIGDLSAECVELQTETQMFSKECLVRLRQGEGVPQYVHFFYNNIPLHTKKRADEIITSIRIN